jgi:hypothetical protein
MWIIAFLAVLALVLDLIVHVAALMGFNPQDWIGPQWVFWVVFGGWSISMVLIASIVEARPKRRAQMRGVIPADNESSVWLPEDIYPPRFRLFARVVMIYAIISLIFWGLLRVHAGDPVTQGTGLYGLDPGHGRAVHQISREQYDRYRRYGMLALSGLFLGVYLQIASDMICRAKGIESGTNSVSERPRSGWYVFVIWRWPKN